ncbi:histidine transporter permease, partial [Pseudomonas fragi]
MIELFQQYGLAYLFSDGSGLSGVAMTLWLFII